KRQDLQPERGDVDDDRMEPDVVTDRRHLEIERQQTSGEVVRGGGDGVCLQAEQDLGVVQVGGRVLEPRRVQHERRRAERGGSHEVPSRHLAGGRPSGIACSISLTPPSDAITPAASYGMNTTLSAPVAIALNASRYFCATRYCAGLAVEPSALVTSSIAWASAWATRRRAWA